MIVLYPGSFDPLTLGHMDIVKRLSRFFSRLIILIAHSYGKSYFFSLEERKKMVSSVFKNSKTVLVDSYSGLTIDYAKKKKVRFILRGLRAVSDFEREVAIANVNRMLYPKIETLIVSACPEYSFISSRVVKEVAFNGGDLKHLVPKSVEKALIAKFKKFKNLKMKDLE